MVAESRALNNGSHNPGAIAAHLIPSSTDIP
jgi:hypothetical protein